jgi:hypothetical protein
MASCSAHAVHPSGAPPGMVAETLASAGIRSIPNPLLCPVLCTAPAPPTTQRGPQYCCLAPAVHHPAATQVLEGMALGAQPSMRGTQDIMLAIAAHKGLAAYALGSSVMEARRPQGATGPPAGPRVAVWRLSSSHTLGCAMPHTWIAVCDACVPAL